MNKKLFSVISPIDGSSVCELEYMGYCEAEHAIQAADNAFPAWKALSPQKRAAILERWYELLVLNRFEIAQIINLESGKPFKEALGEVDYANSFVKFYAQEVLHLFGEVSSTFRDKNWSMHMYEPIGVVGAITPWNFPAAMITKKIAPALAAGCTVVLKPSEETPLTAIKIRDLAIEAGISADIFGIVYGDAKAIGEALLQSSKLKMISFTGSVNVGKYLMKESANTVKKLVLELGGNAPCIVMKDADLLLSVQKIASGKFRNAGQACTAPNRIFIHESIIDKFVDLLIAEIADNKYEIGPLINKAAYIKTQALVDDAIASGAKILFECKIPKNQHSELYFAPIILGKLHDDMRIVAEEIFAPVFSILSFKDNEQVIKRANNTDYGLAAYIFSSDLKATLAFVQNLNFGVIGINETIVGGDTTVHGGFNQSGLGREGGKAGLMEYYESKFIIF